MTTHRYEISNGADDWADAERQINKSTKDGSSSMVVSVKSGKEKKRKASDAVAEALKEAEGSRDGSKKKKSKFGKHAR